MPFVAGLLPDPERSRATLAEYVQLLGNELRSVPAPSRALASPSGHRSGPGRTRPAPAARAAPQLPPTKTPVEVALTGRTKKGGWVASFEQNGLSFKGPVIGTGAPADAHEGLRITVLLKSVTAPAPGSADGTAQFEWIRS